MLNTTTTLRAPTPTPPPPLLQCTYEGKWVIVGESREGSEFGAAT